MIWIIFLLIIIGIKAYAYMGFRSSLSIKHGKLMAIFASMLLVFVGGIFFMWLRQQMNYSNASMPTNLLSGMVLLVFFMLIFSLLVYAIEDIARIFIWSTRSLALKKAALYPKREKTSARIVITLGAVAFIFIFYGILFGFTHYKVHRIVVEHEDIPKSFDGFTIAQLSDMHLGTFGNIKQVEKGLKLLQNENPDLLLFTGDLVNNLSAEAIPYIDLMKAVKAPYGKFAVLGNHDYAHYAGQLAKTDQKTDELKLRNILNRMGFTILENRNTAIHRGNDSIVIAGVENWGIAPFPQYGDLSKALTGVSDSNYVVLLSHDPSHWNEQVLDFPVPVELTLSGHTHGMQMGIEMVNFKWSPVQYRYRNWSGMHEQDGKFLYVNRGFGGIGFPGRIGIRPEITIIELRSKF